MFNCMFKIKSISIESKNTINNDEEQSRRFNNKHTILNINHHGYAKNARENENIFKKQINSIFINNFTSQEYFLYKSNLMKVKTEDIYELKDLKLRLYNKRCSVIKRQDSNSDIIKGSKLILSKYVSKINSKSNINLPYIK